MEAIVVGESVKAGGVASESTEYIWTRSEADARRRQADMRAYVGKSNNIG